MGRYNLRIILILIVGLFSNIGAQWTNPSSLNGAVNTFLMLDSVTILAGTNTGSIYISKNIGANWEKVSDNSTCTKVYCFLPIGDKILAGTDRGFFISTNYGSSWESGNPILNGNPIRCLNYEGLNILAGTKEGIFISDENGENWEKIKLGIDDTICVTSITFDGKNLFAATDGEVIFISNKEGKRWESLKEEIKNKTINSVIAYNNVIFAATNERILSSSDNGKSWNHSDEMFLGVNALYDFDSTIYACANLFSLYYSNNDGHDWTNIGVLHREWGSAYSFIKIGTVMIVGLYEGLYRSTNNGENWGAVGYSDASVNDFIVIGNNLIAGTPSYGILISGNNGSAWLQSNNGLSRTYILSLASNDSFIFAGTYLGGAFRSTDKGKSWQEINSGLKGRHIEKIVVKDGYIFAATNDSAIYRSENNGISWNAVDDGLEGSARHIKSMIGNQGDLIIGTSDGIYITSDNGENWTKSETFIKNTVYEFAKIDSEIFAGIAGDGVYVSKNNGKSWVSVNNCLTNAGVWCLYSDGKNLFAGTAKGLFMSIDKGKNWKEISTGLPSVFIYAITSDDKYLYAGTMRQGIWRRALTDLFNSN